MPEERQLVKRSVRINRLLGSTEVMDGLTRLLDPCLFVKGFAETGASVRIDFECWQTRVKEAERIIATLGSNGELIIGVISGPKEDWCNACFDQSMEFNNQCQILIDELNEIDVTDVYENDMSGLWRSLENKIKRAYVLAVYRALYLTIGTHQYSDTSLDKESSKALVEKGLEFPGQYQQYVKKFFNRIFDNAWARVFDECVASLQK